MSASHQKKSRFSDWCRQKSGLSDGAAHTVDMLLELAGTSDCDEAEQILNHATALDLSARAISNIRPLASLPHLTHLNLSHNRVSDLRPLSLLQELTDLDLEHQVSVHSITMALLDFCSPTFLEPDRRPLSDINPLQVLRNLKTLKIGCNANITDLSPLRTLHQLTELDLNGNFDITDFEPLKYLKNLTTLNLNNTSIADLGVVQSLVNLTHLSLGWTQISDLSPLRSPVKLTHPSLWETQVSDLSPLRSLKKLTHLSLSTTPISDLNPLQSLEKLTSLSLWRTPVSDLSFLQPLTQLTHLDLSTTPVSDLNPLRSLKKLTYLNLDWTQVSDLTPLRSLVNLTQLSLRKTQVSDLSPLRSLTSLTELTLAENRIADLSPLQALNQLTYLDLTKNEIIVDLRPLKSLINLTHLNLIQDELEKLDDPLSLQELDQLDRIFRLELENLYHCECGNNILLPYDGFSQEFYNSFQALSTQPCDTLQIAELIAIFYNLYFQNSNKRDSKIEPKIVFCRSPHEAIIKLSEWDFLGKPIATLFINWIRKLENFNSEIWNCLWYRTSFEKEDELNILVERQLEKTLKQQDWTKWPKRWQENLEFQLTYGKADLPIYLTPGNLVEIIVLTQYLAAEGDTPLKPESQEALDCLQQLAENCGWIFPFENVCFVCDRPRKLSFDSEDRLHAEEEPTIQFADGFSIFAQHGAIA